MARSWSPPGVLDPFNGHPDETHHPEVAWLALATVSAETRHLGEQA
jgi:hypothetical protein